MNDQEKHVKAKRLIDKLVSDLVNLSEGKEISPYWKAHLKNELTAASAIVKIRKTGPKADHEKDKEIVVDYLTLTTNAVGVLEDDGRSLEATYQPESEDIPRGLQAKLARKHGVNDDRITKILKRWREDKELWLEACVVVIARDVFK